MTAPRHIAIGDLKVGNDLPLVMIAGPCVMESRSHAMDMSGALAEMAKNLGIGLIYKTSFDKANRTSATGERGLGLDDALQVFADIRKETGLPVLTDVHEAGQCAVVAGAVDVLQIPAFLCRQTDLLVECGRLGRAVNIKKGQFLAAEDMQYAVEKVTQSGTPNVLVTERGALFGYRDLVVDMRNLVIMRSFGYPVVFDATHSVQQMGAAGGSSGGRPAFIPAQVRGAVAVGIDALFIETHPDPDHALSDGSNMVPLDRMRALLEMTLAIHSTHGTYTSK